jgi:hypothetical protein
MEIYSVSYYPFEDGIEIVRKKDLPVIDEVLYVDRREEKAEPNLVFSCFVIYRFNRVFVVRRSIFFAPDMDLIGSKEDLFLAVLKKNQEIVAIVDWINLLYESVYIMDTGFLNGYLAYLINQGDIWTLASEDLIKKERRRYGCRIPYLKEVFKAEWEKLNAIEKNKNV